MPSALHQPALSAREKTPTSATRSSRSAPTRSVPGAGRPSSTTAVLSLQRCACGGVPGPTGECAACRAKRLASASGLSVSSPTDAAEVQAASVEASFGGAGSPAAGAQGAPTSMPAGVEDGLRSPGRPLAPSVRASMEASFGHDFGDTRIHTDSRASSSARAIDARAYTVGEGIVFGEGQYAPETSAGRALLAHELTHVVQQREGRESAGVFRAVGRLDCTAGVASAPADPAADLAAIDARAREMATQLAADYAADAATVRAGGVPAAPSASLQSYLDHFGLPTAQGTGFLNRITGVVRTDQNTAASEELQIMSRRFALVARFFGDRIHYACGAARVDLGGGCADDCATNGGDAFTCRGSSGIGLCPTFWTGFADNDARAAILIHETFHIIWGPNNPRLVGEIGDDTLQGPGRNFDVAGCWEFLVDDVFGTNSGASCPAIP